MTFSSSQISITRCKKLKKYKCVGSRNTRTTRNHVTENDRRHLQLILRLTCSASRLASNVITKLHEKHTPKAPQLKAKRPNTNKSVIAGSSRILNTIIIPPMILDELQLPISIKKKQTNIQTYIAHVAEHQESKQTKQREITWCSGQNHGEKQTRASQRVY